jgi:hypothetical protein
MARLLSTLLVAIAIFCAPLAMHIGGSAMASPVAVEMGNGCEGMAHHAPDKKKPESRSSCAVACAAIPGLPAALPAEAILTEAGTFTGPTRLLTGIGPEAELPPPRSAPAI